MNTKRTIPAMLLGVAMVLGPALSWSQQSSTDSARQDVRNAGHDSKNAAKDTGHAVKHGTKKAWHKTKHGTKKAWHKTKSTTKGAYNGAKEGAQKPQ